MIFSSTCSQCLFIEFLTYHVLFYASLGQNPNLCLSDSCQGKKKKKKKFLVPVLISILSAIVILILIAAFAIIRKLTNRRETKGVFFLSFSFSYFSFEVRI